MSSRATHWALQQTTELPVDKLVLIALADFADDNNQCFPSRKRLAAIGMCSIDTVDRSIKRLMDLGMISKTERPAERGGLTSNCYTLHVDTASLPSRNLRPPLAADCPHPQPQNAATLAASDAATLAAQDAATKGTKTLTVTGTEVQCSEVLLRSDEPKPKREAHGSRLDRDWSLPDDWRQWARATFPQTTSDRVAIEAETFRDYWISAAGAKGRKADWEATWRNWCRKAFATAPIRPRSQPPANERNELARRMMAMLNTGASA